MPIKPKSKLQTCFDKFIEKMELEGKQNNNNNFFLLGNNRPFLNINKKKIFFF